MNENENVERPLKGRWWLSTGLALGALGLYLVTMSRGVFPGLPARCLADARGLNAFSTLLDSLWGRIVAAFPATWAAEGAGVLSALCGAVCVFFVSALMMRVRYAIHDKYDPDETGRESRARLLAGVVSGLALALCIPFWILSTRSMPGTFHLALLLVTTWFFSEYQRTGRPWCLYGMGLLYGVGVTEFATFWIFAPFAVILVLRAMLQRAEFSWRVLIQTGLCLLPGLLLYLLNAATLFALPGVKLRGFQSMWSVLWYIWRDQWNLIAGAPHMTGFLMVLVLGVVPWGVLFLLRAKKPAWRYTAWQVFLRLAVLAAALGALFNAPLSPWTFFGMFQVMVTPYILLAVCAGYVAGEFWVMGQVREHRKAGVGQPLRSALGWVAIALPVAALVAGVLNFRVSDGRTGTRVARAMEWSCRDLSDGDLVLGTGALDDSLRLCAEERGVDVTVVTLSQTATEMYRSWLALRFDTPRQEALLQVGFSAFLQDYLKDDGHLVSTLALDVANPLREYGYLVPDGVLTRVVPTADRVDFSQVLEEQSPFWTEMEEMAAAPAGKGNPAAEYEKYLLRVASKVVNNTGFSQVERGDAEGAAATFARARKIHPDNVSALLNLLTLAQEAKSADLAGYEAEWEAFKGRHLDSRVMWSLGDLYGYVHNTGYLVRQGMMWAVSGKPQMAEAELRRASGGQAVSPEVKAFLGRAYLHGGDVERGAAFYREAIKANPNDAQSLLMLAEISLASGSYEEAAAFLDQAEEKGIEPARLQFERLVLTYLKGQTDEALAGVKALVKENRGDVRAWAFLAMLTGNGSDKETYENCLKALKNLRGTSPEVRLLLADLYMNRQEWTEARAELEQVARMNPRLVRPWEMLVNVDFSERKRDLAEDHVRMLLTLDPENHTGNLMLGSFQYERGQFSLAESSYRTALQTQRNPTVLNDLAYLLIIKGELAEARELVNEALEKVPEQPSFLSTRAELNLMEGRLDEASADLQQVLARIPDNAQALLLSAELYAARGQKEAALALVAQLQERLAELPSEKKTRLQEITKGLR